MITRVTTYATPQPGAPVVSERVCNLRRSDARKWLSDHVQWAMGQGHGVQCEPVLAAQPVT